MADDRRTKAQILEELAKTREMNEQMLADMPAKPAAVPAATALAGCIRALDAIPRIRSTSSYDRETRPNTAEIKNVMQHLLARYGIDLTIHTVEPCGRLHLEDVADEVLIDRLRGRF